MKKEGLLTQRGKRFLYVLLCVVFLITNAIQGLALTGEIEYRTGTYWLNIAYTSAQFWIVYYLCFVRKPK